VGLKKFSKCLDCPGMRYRLYDERDSNGDILEFEEYYCGLTEENKPIINLFSTPNWCPIKS
jgi:hypothetical protein